MRKIAVILFGLFVGLTLAQQNNADATLLQGLTENEDFSALVGLIDQAGLTADLEGAGPFTILAPANGVFEELDPAILEQLNNDPELLTSVLQSHVLQGAYTVNDLQDAEEGSITTLTGEPLETDLTAGGLTVGGASINSTDVENTYSNGILHEVGDLVLPASLRSQLGLENGEEANAATEGIAFADLDTDADGVLMQDEVNTGLFTRYDANADGIIEQAEYDTNPGLFGGAFADFDADTSGDLNEEEYRGAFENNGLFNQLDTDASGDLSEEEFDTNRDLLGLGAVEGQNRAAVGAETGGAETGGAIGAETGGAETGDAAVVVAFVDLDTDADGVLNQEESQQAFANNPELFEQFDIDGSGDISEEEFNANQDLLGATDQPEQTAGVGAETGGAENADPAILQALTENENFSTLLGLIDQAGLTADLEGAGPFTILAPANGVFEELDRSVLEQLNNDPALLESVLQSHVLQGAYTVKDLRDAEEGSITTLQGEPLETDLTAGGLTVGGASLNSTNVDNIYSNGVLHEVGDLVLPASLLSQLGLGDVEEATDDVTTAAGANFADLDIDGDGVLTQDELNNGIYTRYDANADGIIEQAEYDTNPGLFGGAFADFDADTSGDLNEEEYRGAFENNGLFNQLDTDASGDISQEEFDTNRDLLGLGAAGAAVTGASAAVTGAETGGAETGGVAVGAETGGAETGGATSEAFDGTVVELLTNDGRFGTLLTAINDAGLAESLQEQAPFTLFAPTDDAFAALPDDQRESILGNTDMLSTLLLYHVVPGEVMAETFTGDGQATALEGSDITVAQNDGTVTLNNGQATVTEADLRASDGVVHVIDSVLVPESMMNQ